MPIFQKNLRRGSILIMLTILFAMSSQPARAGEHYYMMLFAAQGAPNRPRFTHSFATFVKVSDNAGRVQIEPHTISWIAATEEVRLARLRPEMGVNLSLRRSLELANSLDETVSMWGPFEIRKELYGRALNQIRWLQSGDVGYIALDRLFRPDVAVNCFHAISDIDSDQGLMETGLTFGNEATYLVAEHLRRWIIRPDIYHDWLIKRMGLGRYEIALRKFED